MRAGRPQRLAALTCGECGREQREGERGWKAYLPPHDEPPETLIFCPECADREFGPGKPSGQG
jgi:hypothetical protein